MSNLKSYKYRLYPTRKQIETLQWTLDSCRELYNAALQERRDAYNMAVRQHPNYYDEDRRKELTKELCVRMHICAYCGLVLDRDVNAAVNILDRGLGRSLREPVSQGMFRETVA